MVSENNMSFVGKIEAFDSTTEDWETYIERVELYFTANDVEEEKKVATLLSLMSTTSSETC